MSQSVVDPFRPDLDRPRGTDREMRQFAAIGCAVLLSLAGTRVSVSGAGAAAVVPAGAGLALLTVGLLRPSAMRPLFSGLMVLTAPLGFAVSNGVLMALFYGVFTPVAFLFRLLRRDALRLRRPAPGRGSWEPVVPARPQRYLRQF